MSKNRLRELRKSNNLTLKELSEKLKKEKIISITPDALAKYERGEREPKLNIWQKLSDFFNVPIGYLQGTQELDEWDYFKNTVYSLHFSNDKKTNEIIQGKLLDLFGTLLDKNEELENRVEDLEDPDRFNREAGDL